ncbi:MAG: hypothetical protein WA740_18180 [Candidatus Binataceae bacterium]
MRETAHEQCGNPPRERARGFSPQIAAVTIRPRFSAAAGRPGNSRHPRCEIATIAEPGAAGAASDSL